MLMRGFTSVRDLGGPVFGLKRAIDSGLMPGPRIWPVGRLHLADRRPWRLPPAQRLARRGRAITPTANASAAAAIADDPDTVRKRVREQLALGASQIKLMAGGGVSSNFDPLDVTQYTVAEMRAAVEAAENWGTYVTVHAYTPRAVRQAIEAGVKCIDHGHLLDDDTAKLMAEKGVWWSLQPFLDDRPSPFAEGSPNRIKQLEMFGGTDTAYALAKKYKIKTAWGTDILFRRQRVAAAQGRAARQDDALVYPGRSAEHGHRRQRRTAGAVRPAQPLSGQARRGRGRRARRPAAGRRRPAGQPQAGRPTRRKNFVVIMKDGKVYKNTLQT